mgnify:CR=1 FL=1|jgi:AraC-like DNA-binding protein
MISTPQSNVLLVLLLMGHFWLAFAYQESNFPNEVNSGFDLQQRAVGHARRGEVEQAVEAIEAYLVKTGDLTVLNDHLFFQIQDAIEYKMLRQKYRPKWNLLIVVYILVAFLGIYLAIVIQFFGKHQSKPVILLSSFIITSAVLIVYLSLHLANMFYYLPNFLYLAGPIPFILGPLMYFYFRTSWADHDLNFWELLHLIPAVFTALYLWPFINRSKSEKFTALHDYGEVLLPYESAIYIMIAQGLSLGIYGILLFLLKQERQKHRLIKGLGLGWWNQHLITLYLFVVAAYAIPVLLLTHLEQYEIFVHALVWSLCSIITFLAFKFQRKPELMQQHDFGVKTLFINKYERTGLPRGYSLELKSQLLKLLQQHKIYTQHSISLDEVAKRLDVTRHHASQVINEHFNMSFFELINSYRIKEAMSLMRHSHKSDIKISEIAFQTGFSSRATFNKQFKKYTQQTPTQFFSTYSKRQKY